MYSIELKAEIFDLLCSDPVPSAASAWSIVAPHGDRATLARATIVHGDPALR